VDDIDGTVIAGERTQQAELVGLRATLHLLATPVAILDANFLYQSVNPAYCALTGYDAEELLGRPFASSQSPETPFEVDMLAAAQSPPAQTLQTLNLDRKDGSVAQIECRIATVGASGIRILVATERSQAPHAPRLDEVFTATISHELRNPLNAILGWATTLSRKPGLPEGVLHGLQAIERNSRIQAQMISDMSDYAGIAFGKLGLSAETIDPYPAVRAALHALNSAAETAGIAIRTSFGEETLRIEADASRLQQIVWSLLDNALKSSARGGQVELTATRSADSFSLTVSDHGKGIDAKSLPGILDRFGLGLGMAVAKQLTELLGGSMHAFSAGQGLGAAFTLKLPLSRATSTSTPTIVNPPECGEPAPPPHRSSRLDAAAGPVRPSASTPRDKDRRRRS
jgi:PAS domain S-box-containing protein